MHLEYIVSQEDNGRRAVDILCAQTGMSRLMSKKVRLYGSLTANGKHIRMIDRVLTGDKLVAVYSPHQEAIVIKEDPLLPILYQDAWILLVNKPAGIVTHPTYLHQENSVTSRISNSNLHPVFRLDKDTSGLLLIALNGHAHHVISARHMEKEYLALVHGLLSPEHGIIDLPIARDQDSIMLRCIDVSGAKAKTKWQRCYYFRKANVSLVKFTLLTGRTHQIRLHSSFIGHPLLGDGLYGLSAQDKKATDKYHNDESYENIKHSSNFEKSDQQGQFPDNLFKRQALHAVSLSFFHPQSLKIMSFTASLPLDFQEALSTLFTYEKS